LGEQRLKKGAKKRILKPGYSSAPPKHQFGQKMVAKGFADGKLPSVTGTPGKLN